MENPSIEITGNTRLIGLLADPIKQVRTPSALNPMLRARGLDLVVVPLHITADNLAAAWEGLRLTPSFAGFLATVPHKGNIPALCDHVEASARQVGAANTVRRLPDGSLACATFDGIGFVGGLQKQNLDPWGKKVILAGAGGAASSVAFALADAGVSELAISNRTRAKAESLASRVVSEYPNVKSYAVDNDPTGFELVVNGTSLGMNPDDALPFDSSKLTKDMVVAEVIMAPEVTPLLEKAEAVGAKVHGGLHMLHEQLNSILDFLATDIEPTLPVQE